MEANNGNVIISADSHVTEATDLWTNRVPAPYRDRAPKFDPRRIGDGFGVEGGYDPHARIKEMETDGVSAEVLYPTLGLNLFGLDDAGLQQACFRVYNDWLMEYCRVAPKRLVGVPTISIYEVEQGIRELERCLKAGLKGALIWQAPHPDLPLHSNHYDRFWAAAQEMGVPVSLHILTGHNYSKNRGATRTVENYRGSVNFKLFDAVNALFDLIFYGVLERFPRLKIVIVENEIGWIPFLLQQWDYYYHRFLKTNPPPIKMEPSSYFYRQVYATFFNDAVGAHNFSRWGVDNYMWSNDFPHGNSTWPNSRRVIAKDLGHLPAEAQTKLLCTNVANLYDIDIPEAARN